MIVLNDCTIILFINLIYPNCKRNLVFLVTQISEQFMFCLSLASFGSLIC